MVQGGRNPPAGAGNASVCSKTLGRVGTGGGSCRQGGGPGLSRSRGARLPAHQVSHFSASPAASPRVYRATMSPCFHRPWCGTAAVGAPAATIRRAMPMRPLCPEKSSPRPAARATARIRLASVSKGQAEHVVVPAAGVPGAPIRKIKAGFRAGLNVPYAL